MNTKQIHIAILDQDEVFVELLVSLLNNYSDITICYIIKDDVEVEFMLLNDFPEIIIIDSEILQTCDETFFEKIKLAGTKIIMLFASPDVSMILRTFAIGAESIIPKMYYRQLPDAIRMVSSSFNPVRILANQYNMMIINEKIQQLSHSEREVFNLLRQGYSRVEIEKLLFKSNHTIRNQINSMLKKLNVATSKEAIKLVQHL